MARSTDCEVHDSPDEWSVISVPEAIDRREKRILRSIRCVECHGKVRAHKAGDWGGAHFEHIVGHKGCSLGNCYDGNRRLHPHAVS